MNPWTRLLATGFFSGYVPVAPGTAGTAAAMVPYLVASHHAPGFGALAWILFLIVISGVAVYTASAGEDVWGPDPGPVVIDEFVGFYVTVAFLPLSPAVGGCRIFLFSGHTGYPEAAACARVGKVAPRVGRGHGRCDRGDIRESSDTGGAVPVERLAFGTVDHLPTFGPPR